MKVLTMISGGDVGGAKTHVLTLLRELGKVIDVDMICFREGEFAEDARGMGIPITIVSHRFLTQTLADIRGAIKSGGYDIIHCHGSRANFIGSLLKHTCKIPVVTTVHSDPKLDYMGRPAGRLIYGTLNSRALRKLDYYIGVSDAMAELLISRGFPPDRIFTIYNGLDFTRKDDASGISRSEYRARLGFDDGCVAAGIAARLNPVKDIATLIRGFADAVKTAPALRLAIAGDGELREALEKLAVSLGVGDKVRFLGWVDDTDSFYRAMDINTLTSVSETFPYALTEGTRYWLATVSSAVGGVPKLIDHGVNGFLFHAGDAGELSGYLSRLANDPQLRAKMGRALGEKARREYSLEATRDAQLQIYRTILRRQDGIQNRRREGVLICGAYGRGNAGDDAILEAILSEMRDINPDTQVTVLSKEPAQTQRQYRVPSIYTFDIPAFRRAMRQTRLYINGGGNLIQDITSRKSLFFYLYNIRTAKKLGNRVIMYGCGIGPLLYKWDKRLAARILNKYVDIITLREEGSVKELADLGVNKPEILLTADPALILRSSPPAAIEALMAEERLPVNGKYIGFALRRWSGLENKLTFIAAAADYAYNKYGLTPVFIAIDHTRDNEAARRVTALMKAPHYEIERKLTSGETIGLMAKMTAVVSMRLHGLIFASGNGLPLIGISYDPKVRSFMQYLGQELYCDLDEIYSGTLEQLINSAIFQSRDRESLTQATARLQELEKLNIEAARRLYEEEDRNGQRKN